MQAVAMIFDVRYSGVDVGEAALAVTTQIGIEAARPR